MPERAFQLFEDMQQQGLELKVITCMAVISAGELTLQLLEEVWLRGLLTDVVTYRAVISAPGKVRDAREGLAALRWDEAAGSRAQCDHLHNSDQCRRADLAALR